MSQNVCPLRAIPGGAAFLRMSGPQCRSCDPTECVAQTVGGKLVRTASKSMRQLVRNEWDCLHFRAPFNSKARHMIVLISYKVIHHVQQYSKSEMLTDMACAKNQANDQITNRCKSLNSSKW